MKNHNFVFVVYGCDNLSLTVQVNYKLTVKNLASYI
jgi:hypothetical protein